jgi:hypothetical protein
MSWYAVIAYLNFDDERQEQSFVCFAEESAQAIVFDAFASGLKFTQEGVTFYFPRHRILGANVFRKTD